MSTQPGKDTIYIDVDDEITAIIDKVRGSHEKIVALVLPKRATVLQSIVNMKLLKRTADEAKKHLVLITGEAGLMPLAASVGMYVAKTLQSKPEIPSGTAAAHDTNDDQEEAVSMADDLDASKPVGEHMRHAPSSVVRPGSASDDETIELDNGTPTAAASGAMVGADAAASAKKKKGGSKFKIPDFNKFRVWGTIAAVAVVVLIVMLYFAFSVLPSASISVKTDSTAIQQTLSMRLNTAATSVNAANNTIPAVSQETQKTVTQQGEATGQVDKGTKASGTIQFYNCNQLDTLSGNNRVLPAGTGVSANGLTFITTQDASVPPSHFNGTNCKKDQLSSPVGITAQNPGDKYNIGPTSYSVASSSNMGGQGSATSGGTTNIVKVVNQQDIDNVKQKIISQDTATIKKELQQTLVGKGLYAIQDSFINKEPEVITNVAAGTEASTVTVTQKTTYTMLGVKQDDLKKIIGDAVNKKIDTGKQQILDYGLDSANFQTQSGQGTITPISMSVTAVAGSDINIASVKQQVAGKKSSEAKDIIGKYPGVTSVTVDYSPFWVSSIPKKTSKITVTIEKPTATKNAN